MAEKEYVDKESLIRHIDNRFGEISTPFVLREIKNFPNADVVEVVRCRDCQHYYDGCCYVGNRSPRFKYDVNIHHRKKDDFCSYGERKE